MNDEGEPICRVCRCEGTPDHALFYPCLCSGSIKYIHQDCLVQWLEHSQNKYCELCKHPFSFSPIYDSSMPQQLPKTVVIVGVAHRMWTGMRLALRYILVGIHWLFLVPVLVTHIWRLYFNAGSVTTIFDMTLWSDCVQGLVIAATNVILFLGLMSLRDYIVSNTPDDDLAPPIAQVRNLQVPGTEADGSDDDEVDDPLNDGVQQNGAAVQAGQQRAGVNDGEGLFNFGALLDGPHEEISLEELLGLKGPLLTLIENVFWFLLFNMVFLALFAFLPYMTGKTLFSSIAAKNISEQILNWSAPVFGFVMNTTSVGWMTTESNQTASALSAEINQNLTSTLFSTQQLDNVTSSIQEIVKSTSANTTFNSSSPSLADTLAAVSNVTNSTAVASLSDVSNVSSLERTIFILVGYMFIMALTIGYLSFVSVVFRGQRESYIHQTVKGGIRFLFIFFKLGLLMICELGFFPLMSGWLLDYCTLDLVGAHWPDRIVFLRQNMITSTYLHWLLGMTYMFHFAGFVGLAREILRPGVLWFLRNPNDPSFNPMHEMIEIPLFNHVRRMSISAVLYSIHIFVMVFCVVQTALVLCPSMLPLRFTFDDPLTELPVDLLFYHFIFPLFWEHIKPRQVFKSIVDYWLRTVANRLNLSAFLLGGEHPDEVIEGGVVTAVPNVDSYRPTTLRPAGAATDQATSTTFTSLYIPPRFWLRIAALLTLLFISSAAFVIVLVLTPVSIGRAILQFVLGRPAHELYTFSVGVSVLFFIHSLFQFRSVIAADISFVTRSFQAIWKGAYLAFIGGVLFPSLAGLLFDVLIVKPFTVPVNQSPVVLIFEDWAIGILLCSICFRAVLVGPESPVRTALERIRLDSLAEINILDLNQKVILPATILLLGFLFLPFVVATFIHWSMLETPLMVSACYRFAHCITFCCFLLVVLLHGLSRWIAALQLSVRDEHYLIGRQLHNFTQQQQQSPPTSILPSQMAAAAQ